MTPTIPPDPMAEPIDELLERMRKNETDCRELAARLEKYGDTLAPPEREASEDVADSVQRMIDEAGRLACWIAAVEELVEYRKVNRFVDKVLNGTGVFNGS